MERRLRSPLSRMLVRAQLVVAVIVLVGTLPLNAWHLYNAVNQDAEMPRFILAIADRVDPFRICSGYGLFRVMTKDRREIVIEGSRDGVEWSAYEFKWKPGDPDRVPGWCAPHQPRLDWQMWFAALSTARQTGLCGSWNVSWRTKPTLPDCWQRIRFRKEARPMFALGSIGIASHPVKNAGELARGGRGRNSANTCLPFR